MQKVRPFLLTASLLISSLSLSPAATVYWDVNGGDSGVGGTGSWVEGGTNWSSVVGGTSPIAWANSNRDIADFRGTAGTVTTSGAINADSLVFNAGGYSLTGSSITLGRAAGATSYTVLNVVTAAADTTVSNDFTINDPGSAGTSNITYTFRNSTASTLTLQGDISVTSTAGTKNVSLLGSNAASVINLEGDILTAATGIVLTVGGSGNSGAVYNVSGNNVGVTGSQNNKGTLNLLSDTALGTGALQLGTSGTGASDTAAVLTSGARTIGVSFSMGGANALSQLIVGGGTAHLSTYTGGVNFFSGTQTLRLSSVTGGRTNFSGAFTNGGTGLLVIQGNGIVGLTRATGNTYTRNTSVSSGTLLLGNLSGSATGTGTIALADGAAIAGSGFASGLVTTAGTNSILNPGELTLAGISSTGTLTLNGGLDATNGGTFKLQLGSSQDLISLGSGVFTGSSAANGLLFKFSNSGGLIAGTPYTMLTFGSSSGLDYADLSASLLPSGFTLDSSFGSGGFQINSGSLQVQFATVPEPSVCALLTLGFVCVMARRSARGGFRKLG